MTGLDSLRRRVRGLDDEVLPSLAVRARRLADRSAALTAPVRGRDPRAELDRLVERVRLAVVEADRAARARLGTRLTAAVATGLAAVLVAGAALAVTGNGAAPSTVPVPLPTSSYAYSQPALVEGRVGPVPGTLVSEYLTVARAGLTVRLATDPDAPAYAIVDLTRYATPADAAGILAGRVRAVRVLARVPRPDVQTSLLVAPVSTLPGDIATAYAAQAGRKKAEAVALQQVANRLPEGDADRRATEQAAAVARAEAVAWQDGCACVYAFVVQAPVRDLADLARAAGVRAVDVAPPGRPLGEIRFTGLLPEQTDRITVP